jgi:hypothetical protein
VCHVVAQLTHVMQILENLRGGREQREDRLPAAVRRKYDRATKDDVFIQKLPDSFKVLDLGSSAERLHLEHQPLLDLMTCVGPSAEGQATCRRSTSPNGVQFRPAPDERVIRSDSERSATAGGSVSSLSIR